MPGIPKSAKCCDKKPKLAEAQQQCDCVECSQSEGKQAKLPKPIRNCCEVQSRTDTGLINKVSFDAPCRSKCADIIKRNKIAIRILSNHVRQQKKKQICCESRYRQMKHATSSRLAKKKSMNWSAAVSMAQDSTFNLDRCEKRRPQVIHVEEPKDKWDCACEQMARAIRADMHHHMGLSEQREKINAGTPDDTSARTAATTPADSKLPSAAPSAAPSTKSK